jgi:hypothetical protein
MQENNPATTGRFTNGGTFVTAPAGAIGQEAVDVGIGIA